jgi:hypothetical protein
MTRPKGLEQAANIVANRLALRNELSARHEPHAQCLRIHALDGDLAEPPGPHHLGETMRVIGVGLVHL